MFFQTIEWQPASLCSYDNGNDFGGDTFGGGGDYGGGQFGSAGGGNSVEGMGGAGDGTGSGGIGAAGSGDFGLGGPGPMSTTAADWGALSTLAATGIFAGFGMTGWSGATFAMANALAASYGTTLDVALGHLSADIANSTAW